MSREKAESYHKVTTKAWGTVVVIVTTILACTLMSYIYGHLMEQIRALGF